MNTSIILLRHTVGVAIVLAIHSFALSLRNCEGVGFLVGYWGGSIVVALSIAGAISGLGYLFFTSYLKGKGGRTFVICAWVTAGVLLFGQWVLPDVVQRIKSADSKSAPYDAADAAFARYEAIQKGRVTNRYDDLIAKYEAAGRGRVTNSEELSIKQISRSLINQWVCRTEAK